jgi:hypothetical protein
MPENPTLQFHLVDSARRPIQPDFKYLLRINNGFHKSVHADFHNGQPPRFDVEFFDNFGDDYSVLVSAKKHHDAGYFPVRITAGGARRLSLMLMPKRSRYDFTNAGWDRMKQEDPESIRFLSRGLPSEEEARGLYEQALDGPDRRQDSMATIHNILTVLKSVELSVGRPLDYFKQLDWNQRPPERDRFFAFADRRLVEQIEIARAGGTWKNASVFSHPGATSAFKQIQFGEANVQLSFHENPQDTLVIDGVDCVKVEADIDYFKDPAAHFLLEVIPNAFSNNRTNPKIVYLLRWIAGDAAGQPDFNPPYTIEAVDRSI